MAVEKTHPNGMVEMRRSREASIVTLQDREHRLTLYRDHLFKPPGAEQFIGGRDDKPVQVTASQIETLEVEDQNGEVKSGDYAMDLLSRFFDEADERFGVSLRPPAEPEPEPEPEGE